MRTYAPLCTSGYVHVHGAVEEPGVVLLASDQLSLFGALSAAGGIIKASNRETETGAKRIRVRRPGDELSVSTVLPVKPGLAGSTAR